jgi:subtilisin-like proprotein convertase family protein
MENRRFLIATAAAVFCSAGLAHAQSFSEHFDDILTLPSTGWFSQNNSAPLGIFGWFQGNPDVFPPHATEGYLGANLDNTAGVGTISNWMVTPMRALQNDQTLNFWTRTELGSTWADRLQVRMSLAGNSTNVGTGPLDVGDFTTLLLDINPTLLPTGYPMVWTQFNVVVSGVGSPTNGRLAFRYFVENGGPGGVNSDYIGIDEVVYTAPPAATGSCCLANGQCIITSSAACTGQGGTYRGDNTTCAVACPQPPSGACCLLDGSCSAMSQAACTTAGGIYRGNNTACGVGVCPNLYNYVGSTVAIPDGTGPNACGTTVFAQVVVNDSFVISDAQAGFFISHTYQGDVQVRLTKVGGPTVSLVDRPGYPQVPEGFANDNYGASSTSVFRSTDSAANIYDQGSPGAPANSPVGAWKPESPLAAFNGINAQGTWRLEASDCFASDTGAINNFILILSGTPGPAPCYANCDGSTQPPILNVLDFVCFQALYAQASTLANCDNSTQPPILNVLDFICFQGKYAQGCP